MNLKNLSNEQLHQQSKFIAEKERTTTIEVLWHLRENAKRMLYALMGYRDLKEYCVKELKYSEGSAWRRISAMKMLVDLPEIEVKIQSGDLNLTQVSMAKTHFREVKATLEERRETLCLLENQTQSSTERILAEKKSHGFSLKPSVVEKPLHGNRLEVTLILDEELQDQLEEIQILLGKKSSKLELFKILAQEKLEKLRQQKFEKLNKQNVQPRKRKAQPLRSPTAAKSRYISKFTLKEVNARDQGRCQYKNPNSGRQCQAQHGLQIEHIVPFSKGGSNEGSNLQLLCPNHNRLRAVQHFGPEKMQKFLPSLR